ncbi:beta-N-acetylglucosaminidase [Planctomonas sp. JC2975]|uniref:beta-N-acetylhexosaminidase family protein n=1 Tax=Planctomonas sp. JC2975 TaxID=2729626 RepID=UPI0014739BCE|nr:beta-N-acetylglucosaminidase domain-containing protein [Planctomonas sp. JC2975]NNC13634.1 beta-N-acetylglucosaminidase [Planctomonas sp. JC2975]
MPHPSRKISVPVVGVVAAAVLGAGLLSSAPANAATHAAAAPASSTSSGLPVITPTPQQIAAAGAALHVPHTAQVLTGSSVDASTIDVIKAALTAAGVRSIVQSDISAGAFAAHRTALTVVVGSIQDQDVADALRSTGGSVPSTLPAEGYSLASKARANGGSVVLAGNDGDGVYYAAQTLRQLVTPGRQTIAAATIVDYPSMPLRGAIEGFYGAPWSQSDRLDQLAFYGDVKANTYIYTPKDDVYLRDEWRDPYPAADLADLKQLITSATAHHVHFTYALAPGLSICYSDPSDIAALESKLQSIYDIGGRSFYISLDDISYTKWNCTADQTKYGNPGQASAGQAQADLLNTIQHDFLDKHAGTSPLEMVPTEYSDTADSPYKSILRQQLDPRIIVQWTGTAVVPPSISVADAQAASDVWRRKVFLWDNYPVDDYSQTTGRLLLAPYADREAGLHTQLAGIVLNPMQQAAASKFALFGGASFAWNDEAYNPDQNMHAAAQYMAGGDQKTADALLALVDVEHLAPTFGTTNWQPQAPVLAARIAAFKAGWSSGDPAQRQAALRALSAHADELAAAPAQIRAGVKDQAFLAETKPWLDALTLWGQAFQNTMAGLKAGQHGAGQPYFDRAAALASQASAITTIPGTTRPQGKVKVADGVLDTFIAQAPGLLP